MDLPELSVKTQTTTIFMGIVCEDTDNNSFTRELSLKTQTIIRSLRFASSQTGVTYK